MFSYVSRRTRSQLPSSENLTDVVRKRSEGQQHGGRDHVFLCTLHLEICFGRASTTYLEYIQVFRLDVDGVFVWLVARVHELIRHLALMPRIAFGYLRFSAGCFLFLSGTVLLPRVRLVPASGAVLLSEFRRLNSKILSLSFIRILKEIIRHVCVRVRVSVCLCGCLCSRVRIFDVFFLFLELVFMLV